MKKIIMKVNQGRNYIYSTPTKSMEFLNGFLSIFFGLVFLANGTVLGLLKLYLNFSYIGPKWVWGIPVLLGVLQLKYACSDSLESNVKSALIMHTCALMWFIISLLFGSDYPPLSTGFFTYLCIAAMCSLTALHLDGQNTYELLLRKEIKDA